MCLEGRADDPRRGREGGVWGLYQREKRSEENEGTSWLDQKETKKREGRRKGVG